MAIKTDALKNVYQRYWHLVYLYLYAMCKNTTIAEDLAQDTFLKALLSLPDGHVNVQAWLYKVARNLYLNERKREDRCATLDEVSSMPDDTQGDLPERLIRSEERRLLFQGISQLSPNKREIMHLHYFGGLSQKQIASVLGLSLANVRVLALRAKRELKIYLEENGYDLS